jgi:hypothetical protein
MPCRGDLKANRPRRSHRLVGPMPVIPGAELATGRAFHPVSTCCGVTRRDRGRRAGRTTWASTSTDEGAAAGEKTRRRTSRVGRAAESGGPPSARPGERSAPAREVARGPAARGTSGRAASKRPAPGGPRSRPSGVCPGPRRGSRSPPTPSYVGVHSDAGSLTNDVVVGGAARVECRYRLAVRGVAHLEAEGRTRRRQRWDAGRLVRVAALQRSVARLFVVALTSSSVREIRGLGRLEALDGCDQAPDGVDRALLLVDRKVHVR